ncbi:sulfatase-like hydrolase/transferase [Mycoplasma cottewii]|uniref:Sulfatase-like hydrolase/transferase n=1 Tax=Mycoplasma cottewii TaxID=51364 RepID=A0ABY5TWT9_9MOLU|nr:sulfatase-like hydrolase/transferase [Mycoplasma cottewii]UWD35148.1 sulfatase-like hydrolase/transferase [Mycoplasma cottewii]
MSQKSKKILDKVLHIFIYVIFLCLFFTFLYTRLNSNYLQTVTFFAIPLKHKVLAIIGDISILLVLFSVILLFKNKLIRILLMNLVLILLIVYLFMNFGVSKYATTAFPFYDHKIENASQFYINAGKNAGAGYFLEYKFYLLIIYIILFDIYAITYLILNRKYFKDVNVKKNKSNFSIRLFKRFLISMCLFSGGLTTSFLTFWNYNTFLKNTVQVESSNQTLMMQMMGKLNYVLYSSYDPFVKNNQKLDIDKDKLNINKYSRLNSYSKNILANDKKNLDANSKIYKIKDSIKNIIYVQFESTNHLFSAKDNIFTNTDYLPNLRALLKESYVLDNFYSNAGVGNSADGTLGVSTGIIPTGNRVSSKELKRTKSEIQFSLPRVLTDFNNYIFEPNNLEFYHYNHFFEKSLGHQNRYYFTDDKKYRNDDKFNVFNFKEIKNLDGSNNIKPTLNLFNTDVINDQILPSLIYDVITNNNNPNKKDKNFFHVNLLFPHAPFNYYKNKVEIKNDNLNKLSTEGRRYLNAAIDFDNVIKQFIKLGNKLKDTMFVFYSDHPHTGLNKNDLEIYYNKKLTWLEYVKLRQKILAFVYIPDKNNDPNSNQAKGILKGVNKNVRSHIDIYATMLELFSNNKDYHYFGTNIFTDEKTYNLDPRNMLLITDDFSILGNTTYSSKDEIMYEISNENIDLNMVLDKYNLIKQDKIIKDKYFMQNKLNELYSNKI